MFTHLTSFIEALERKGQLKRISAEVSCELEITQIADRLVKQGGPALLFEKVQGKDFPVFIGGFGTAERTAFALGVGSLDDLAKRIQGLMHINPGKGGLGAAMSLLPKLGELKGFFPKTVRQAAVQQVVLKGEDINLDTIPVLKCWPQDGGPFITLPLVISQDPETLEPNLGMYRVQVLDKTSTAMHWQLHKTGRRHYDKAKAMGVKLPVAIAIGGDPILTYAATAPVPPIPGVTEYNLAGFLRKAPLELVKGVTVDLMVPAEAEFIIEGYIDPAEDLVVEGPFGDHTGFYTLEDMYPKVHVTAITHRRGAIYPATIVGRPPMEDAYLIEASERLFLPAAQLILPEIKDYHMPPAGVAHNWVNVGMDKRFPGHAYKVANGMLGLGQMMFAKMMVVLDDGQPLKGVASIQAALRHAIPGRDTLVGRGPIDVLDHSSRAFGFGGKLTIDGTKKLEPEAQHHSIEPFELKAHPVLPTLEGVAHAQLEGIWMATLQKSQHNAVLNTVQTMAASPQSEGIRLIMLSDPDTTLEFDDMMWSVLNNIDPERDSWITQGQSGPILVLDGTKKLQQEGFDRRWPDKIVMDANIVQLVQSRRAEYGLQDWLQ